MKEIIEVGHPNFYVHEGNPTEVIYYLGSTKEANEYHQIKLYEHQEILEPNEGEVVYRLKSNHYMGYRYKVKEYQSDIDFIPTVDLNLTSSYITSHSMTIQLPLQMEWEPKEDITAYELSMCLPYLLGANLMPGELDETKSHFRHFKITDHNKK